MECLRTALTHATAFDRRLECYRVCERHAMRNLQGVARFARIFRLFERKELYALYSRESHKRFAANRSTTCTTV